MSRPRRYPSDLSDEEWTVIEPLLPPAKKDGRPEKHPHREIADAILYLTHNGCVWRALPADFPPWRTVYEFDRPGKRSTRPANQVTAHTRTTPTNHDRPDTA